MTNHLYYGDNLRALRDHIGDECVDLIYLDPEVNSNARNTSMKCRLSRFQTVATAGWRHRQMA